MYGFVKNYPLGYFDPQGLHDWWKIIQGSVEITMGFVAFGVATAAETVTFGVATVAYPTVFLGISHGTMTLGAGLDPEPTPPDFQKVLDIYPSGPGQLYGMGGYVFGSDVGQISERTVGLLWDIGTLGKSTVGVLNAFADGERMVKPLADLGLDSASMFYTTVDFSEMFLPDNNRHQNHIDINSYGFGLYYSLLIPSNIYGGVARPFQPPFKFSQERNSSCVFNTQVIYN